MPGANVGMVNIGDIFGNNNVRKKGKKKKMSVKESHEILIAQESDKMIEEDNASIKKLQKIDSLESFARENYGYKKENETIYIIETN